MVFLYLFNLDHSGGWVKNVMDGRTNIFDREYSNQLLLDSCQVGAGLLVHHKPPHLSLIINLVVGIHQVNLECFVILFFVVLTSSLSCRKSRACQSSLYWS